VSVGENSEGLGKKLKIVNGGQGVAPPYIQEGVAPPYILMIHNSRLEVTYGVAHK